MAQCYTESSKPIGGTFDMCGGAYTGRLYCSVYAGDNLKQYHQQNYATSTRTTIDRSTNNVMKQQQQQQNSDCGRDRDESSMFQRQQKAASPPPPPPTPPPPPPAASFSSDDSSKLRKSGEIAKNQRASDSSSSSSSSSSSKSGKSSGEITEQETSSSAAAAAAAGAASKSSNGSSRQGTILGSRAAYQSWPSSPANFRPTPRTRNLSEGSFSMIFPEDGSSRIGPRSGSPTKHRTNVSCEKVSLGGQTSSRTGAENAAKLTPSADTLPRIKRGEVKEVSGRPRSYTGSPPRTTSSSSGNIRHTRNSSDGNWSTITGGNLLRNPSKSVPTTPAKVQAAVPRTRDTASSNGNGNGGFITGGSFARVTEKVAAPEVSPPCSNGSTLGGVDPPVTGATGSHDYQKQSCNKKGPTESYGTGNVYLMGESMLLKKALSSNDPEEVKNIGNEQYKKNHFLEALSLYDRAIMLSPGQAAYHSNKGAALIALGRLAEAVHECQTAVHFDHGYSRAHQRLGALFLRLGRIDEAKRHFKAGGPIDGEDSRKMEMIALRLSRSHQARQHRDWRTILRETDGVIDAGADSSVQAYALKAEALLNLNKLSDAETTMTHAKKLGSSLAKPKHAVDERMLYTVQAELDIAQGRFEDAVTAADKALRNEPYNSEVSEFVARVRKIGRARTLGNDLFKSGKYFEAAAAYGEGLQLDPVNAIFFCNRAACRSKLRLWEKAIEDCNSALSIQSDYTKALLRRAQCNTQLERWVDALRDYEVLKGKLPGDVDIARALFDVQVAIKRSKGEEVANLRFGGEIEEVYSSNQLKEAITSPGLAVVHFISRWSERCRQMTPFIDQLCKRYPSVTFVKVDIENHPCLAKTEHVGTVPTFKVYKNGLKMTEMLGPSQQKLEDAVQHYIL